MLDAKTHPGARYSRTIFGDPIPTTLDEIAAAFLELSWTPDAVDALVHPPDPENSAPFTGWTADLVGPDGRQITTAGFKQPNTLTVGLTLLGVANVEFA